MNDILSQKNKQNIKCIIACIFGMLALHINLDMQEEGYWLIRLFDSLKNVEIFNIILFPLLYQFYKRVCERYEQEEISIRSRLTCLIPAVLFAFFMVMGYSFYATNSWNLVFGSKLQLLKSMIAFCGYASIFYFSIRWLFYYIDHLDITQKEGKFPRIISWYLNRLRKHPFGTCFLTLAILYLPYMAISYPGIIGNDARRQISEGYNYFHGDGSGFRNQHPFMHTFLITFFLIIGDTVFHSANIGIFLYSCTQAALLFAAVSSAVKLMAELNYANKYLVLLILYFVLTPRTQNYLFLVAKDALFASFLTLFIIQLYRVSTGHYGSKNKKSLHWILLYLFALGVFFIRQDGIYLLLITFLCALFLNKENRKRWCSLGMGMLAVYFLFQLLVIPGLGLKPSSKREMLSIPFQQTARYLKEAGDDVTEEEQEAISAILNYDNLAELYNPNLSDPVKSTFNEDATSEDLAAYFKVWFQMLWKHPGIYVQATMNNLYGYFYPDGHLANLYNYEKSSENMEKMNEEFGETYGLSFSYPDGLNEIRLHYELFREMIYKLPVLSVLLSPGFYVWCLLLCLFFCIRQKRTDYMLILIPAMILLLIFMAGPAYGWYFRYLYSLTVCLPVIMLLGLRKPESA